MSNLPRIYLINLDRDTERLAFMIDQLTALGLPFQRVAGVHGIDMPEWLKPYFLTRSGKIASELTAGEVGCYASHLLVLKTIVESGRPGLVLEDDVRLGASFPALLERIEADLPADWDIVRLSNRSKRRRVLMRPILDRHVVKYSVVPAGAGAYLITPLGAHRFLHCKPFRKMPVDQDLRFVWEFGLVTYGISPAPVQPNVMGQSSIARFGPILRSTRFVREAGLVDGLTRRIPYELRWLGLRDWLLARMWRRYKAG